jgi:probable HAF family extracellular repeat protein
MTNLGTVDGDPCSQANMINSKSQIVGTSATCDFFTVQHAFIWEKGQMTDLNTVVPAGSDLQLLDALEINERGEIVGQGAMANGDQHVFLLIPCDRDHFDGEACRENDLGGTTAMQNSASKCSRGSDTHGNCSSHARPAWSESHFRDLATQVIHLTNRRRARKFRLEKA